MKKTIRLVFVAACAMAAFACSQKVDIAIDAQKDSTSAAKTVTISATLTDAMTKVAFDPSYSSNKPIGMSLTWEDGDQIRIYNAADHSQYSDFTLDAASIGQNVGLFTGDEISAASYDVEVINAAFDYAAQSQAADGDTGSLKYLAGVSGITDYSSITFTEFSSVLAITAGMPSGVAEVVKSVELVAGSDIFAGGNTLTITLDSAGDAGSDNILHFFATLPQGDQAIAAGTPLFVKFYAPGTEHTVYTRYLELPAGSFTNNKVNALNINATQTASHAGATSCDGTTAAKAYLIADKYQLNAMHDEVIAGSKRYFKLVADIDMSGISWTPLCVSSPYDLIIDFNGNSKTISNLSSSGKYASFAGVLNGAVYDVVFDSATISSTAEKCGVVAGFLGTTAESGVSATCHGVTVKNSAITNTARHCGGIAGIAQVLSEAIDDCHVLNTTVTGKPGDNQDARAGGLLGEIVSPLVCSNCSATDVTVSGSKNVGGLIGVAYGTVENCYSSGSLSSPNTTSNCDIAVGGLVGYFETGVIRNCHSSASINQTTNGRDIGGLLGLMHHGTLEKSYATGSVTGQQRNVGGLIGLLSISTGSATISDCYCTGNVKSNSYLGGMIGLCEKGSATIDNCYAAGNVEAVSFNAGGLIGYQASDALIMRKCAAWNAAVTPATYGAGNWSSGAVCGVTFPKCTLTANYRNPEMSLTAYWVPDMANFQHADVSPSHPLTNSAGEEMTDQSLKNNSANPNYPQYPYNGKVETGNTLSELASTTLGWDGSVWDFSGDLPTLR